MHKQSQNWSGVQYPLNNKNLWRIRALSWYLIMTYQSHKFSNKQLLLWKIPNASNQGLPLVNLRKKLSPLRSRFSYMYRRGLSAWQKKIREQKKKTKTKTKNQGHLSTNYQFLMKRRQQKIRCQTMNETMAKPAGVVKNHEKIITWNGAISKLLFFSMSLLKDVPKDHWRWKNIGEKWNV